MAHSIGRASFTLACALNTLQHQSSFIGAFTQQEGGWSQSRYIKMQSIQKLCLLVSPQGQRRELGLLVPWTTQTSAPRQPPLHQQRLPSQGKKKELTTHHALQASCVA